MTTTSPHHHRRRARRVGATKIYGEGETEVRALDDVDVEFERGAVHRDHGAVGLGQVDAAALHRRSRPLTSGQVFLGDIDLSALSEKQLTQVRRDRIGFVFQTYNLIPTLTALENITLPMALAGREPDQEWLDHVIDTVGLRDRLKHRPSELSGGQQQRVAVARALAQPARDHLRRRADRQPRLASRAPRSSTFMRQAVDDFGQTIVMVTHDPIAAVVRGPRRVPRRRPRSSTSCATRPRTAILDKMRQLGD